MSRFESEHYLVLNGDNYVDYSFDLFYDFYFKRDCDVLILVKKVNDAQRYGTVKFDKNNKVMAFKEKDPNISAICRSCFTTEATLASFCIFNDCRISLKAAAGLCQPFMRRSALLITRNWPNELLPAKNAGKTDK